MPAFNSKTAFTLEQFNAITRVDKIVWSNTAFQCLAPGATLPPTTTPTATPTPTQTTTNGTTPTPTPTTTNSVTPTPTVTSTPTPTPTQTSASNVNMTSVVVQTLASAIPVDSTRQMTIIINGVNIGSSYDVKVQTDMYSNVQLTDYPWATNTVVVAQSDPMEVGILLSNQDFSSFPDFGTNPLRINNFGRNIIFKPVVTEVSRPVNTAQGVERLISYANVRNLNTFGFTFADNSFAATIIWDNARIYLIESNGRSLADISATVNERNAGMRKTRANITLANGQVKSLDQPYRYLDSPLSELYIDGQNTNGQTVLSAINFQNITAIAFVVA